MTNAIEATTFDEETCNRIITQLARRFVSGSGVETGDLLIDRIRTRRAHFFNLPSADPRLSKPWDKAGYTRQTTQLATVHSELKARLLDPDPLVRVEAHPDTATNRANGEDLAEVLNVGWQLIQERTGQDIIGNLIDGMAIDCYGVLHWTKADDIWPEVPDYDYLDELPNDAEKENYYPRKRKAMFKDGKPVKDGESQDGAETKMVYREKPDSIVARRRTDKARAGFPWYIEAVDPATVYWVRDRSLSEGEAMVVVVREIGVLDYAGTLQKDDQLTLSLNQLDNKVRIYGETDAPDDTLPTGSSWGYSVAIAQVWTRDEFYELCSDHATDGGGAYDGQWTLVKSHKHPYERPPFTIVPAIEVNVADPSLRYQPILNNMFQVKSRLDHQMALLDVIATSTAVPVYYLSNVQTGQPKLLEDGSRIELTTDSAAAIAVPDGYELKELRPDISQGFMQSVEFTKQEMEEAKPSTGQADVSAATKPWTARISVQQANVAPAMWLGNIATGLSIMFRNMAKVMSKSADDGGFGEEIVVFSRTTNGKADSSKTVGIAPEDISSLDVSVELSKVSAPERITLEEHGRELLNDPKVGLTRVEFIEDYEGKPNAEDVDAMRKGTAMFEQFIEHPWLQQKAAAWLGTQFMMGPNGQDIGAGGQVVSPDQVAQANGITPMQQPQPQGQPMPQGQGMGGQAGPNPGAPLQPMGALSTPGTIPLQGQVG